MTPTREIIYSGAGGDVPSLLQMQCADGEWFIALFFADGSFLRRPGIHPVSRRGLRAELSNIVLFHQLMDHG
jgi:hypothetical protein